MVAHPEHMVLGTLYHGRTEQGQRRELLIGVALHIGFCQHVETVFVAEVIEYGIVGVVAGADGIDVETLHRLDVLLNLSRRDGSAIDR